MKIKVKELSYEEVLKIKSPAHKKPLKQSRLLKKLISIVTKGDLKDTNFTYKMVNMEEIRNDTPCLIVMNHSSIIDLEMVFEIFKKKPFNIVCTDDGFVGKEGLIRHLGCIPTYKFITDTVLVRDMVYTINSLKSSILIYPEASYTFDGTTTPLPVNFGKVIKLLKVPVVMIKTSGAFLRDPLYNNLQKRKVNTSATVTCILSKKETEQKSAEELFETVKNSFIYDHFKEQKEKKILIKEPFRADYLNRVLYKCPCCLKEGTLLGKGITISCSNCNVSYTLNEDGTLSGDNLKFSHIPDWYQWERECVRKEIEDGNYKLSIDVDIFILKDYKAIYKVGKGHLTHDKNGFDLNGCGGKLKYIQKAQASYSLYSDYFWYELGDMICIGNPKIRYYCFPKDKNLDVVAKTRLATEEIYKLAKSKED